MTTTIRRPLNPAHALLLVPAILGLTIAYGPHPAQPTGSVTTHNTTHAAAIFKKAPRTPNIQQITHGARLSGIAGTPRPPVEQTPRSNSASRSTARTDTPRPVSGIINLASQYAGTPYVYGGTTPRGFDCSGYTRYVYAKAGINLPRTSRAQYAATRHIPASQRQIGDLVFFHGHGGVYHVGIYAGDGMIWHSPKPGRTVRKEAIWTGSVTYGRIR